MDIQVPYQSPRGQENLCWVSMAVAANNFLNRNKMTFDSICKAYPECKKDAPGDLDVALLNIGIRPRKIGNDLSDSQVVEAVKENLSKGIPIVLRLETATGFDASSHFIFITGFTREVPTRWYVKDPSGANVGGKDVPNSVAGPFAFTRRYENKYKIRTVAVLDVESLPGRRV